MEIIVQWICFFNPTGHGDVQQNWDSKRDHVTISHVVGMKWDYHWMCPHFAEGFFLGSSIGKHLEKLLPWWTSGW